jgi:hypothetical protein
VAQEVAGPQKQFSANFFRRFLAADGFADGWRALQGFRWAWLAPRWKAANNKKKTSRNQWSHNRQTNNNNNITTTTTTTILTTTTTTTILITITTAIIIITTTTTTLSFFQPRGFCTWTMFDEDFLPSSESVSKVSKVGPELSDLDLFDTFLDASPNDGGGVGDCCCDQDPNFFQPFVSHCNQGCQIFLGHKSSKISAKYSK